jgi:hypothetical protein
MALRIWLVTVHLDDAWTNLGAAQQRQLQKELGCDGIACGRQPELYGVASGIHRTRSTDGTMVEWSTLRPLGKNSCGKGCLYIKKLSDVDRPTRRKLIQETVQQRKIATS